MMTYRAAVNSSKGKSPKMMTFGREVVLPLQAIMGKPVPEENESFEVEDYVSKL